MFIAVLLSLFCVAYSATLNGVCPRGDWSAWSTCKSTKACRTSEEMEKLTVHYSMEATTYDEGREKMKMLMDQKRKMHEQRIACVKDGSCFNHYPKSQAATPCVGGFAGDYECLNVDLLSFVSLSDLGYSTPLPGDTPAGNDIWVWHDTVTDDWYAIACTTGGTSFVRITDPLNPVVLGFLYTHTGPAVWRDAKVIGDVAYIVADEADHGMQVFDLTQLRGKNDFTYLEETNFYGRVGNVHNIAANVETKTLFCVGATQAGYDSCRGGLHMIDVSDPLNPVYSGCFADDGYVHDTQCVIYRGPDVAYQGREICFGFNEDTLTIVDVTNRANPTLVSKTGYGQAQYTHQGWLTDDQTIVLLDDELDERNNPGNGNTQTYAWDVRSLESPVLRNVYSSSETAIDHNQYVSQGYTFQSNYEAGLRILWIDQPNFNLIETGFF